MISEEYEQDNPEGAAPAAEKAQSSAPKEDSPKPAAKRKKSGDAAKSEEEPVKKKSSSRKKSSNSYQDEVTGESPSIKTPSVMRLVADTPLMENPVLAAGRSRLPRQLRGMEQSEEESTERKRSASSAPINPALRNPFIAANAPVEQSAPPAPPAPEVQSAPPTYSAPPAPPVPEVQSTPPVYSAPTAPPVPEIQTAPAIPTPAVIPEVPKVRKDITEMVIKQNAPAVLLRFNACDCEHCRTELARLAAEDIPSRYVNLPENADLSYDGFSEDEKLLIKTITKTALSAMVKLMISNKRRNYH